MRGEKPFGQRELQIVHHFHDLVGPLIGSALASVAGDPLAKLRPRVGETLLHLLAGDGEAQAAARMRISRHTLHDYVKQLHRHFEVSCRRELVARCRALMGRSQAVINSGKFNTVGSTIAALPPRVQQTLRFLLRGESNKTIVRKMCISPHTVRDYTKRLYAELDVSSRAELNARCWILSGT